MLCDCPKQGTEPAHFSVYMRDLALFGFLAFILVKIWKAPYIGALAWVLFGVMNPHRLAWGPAFSFPFAQLIALALLTAILLSKDHKEVKGGAPAVVMAIFLAWCAMTTVVAFQSDAALDYFIRVTKTFVMTWVIMVVLNTRRHVDLLILTLVIGIGFYGVKGGLFVLATGGNHMVNGPPGGAIEGNNSLAVGLVSTIPLIFYLMTQAKSRWLRRACIVAMVLCAISILGSFSRGALLAIFGMGAMLWLRGSHKTPLLVAAVAFVLIAIPLMPERWTAKMQTIETYQEDNSAMYRLQTWETAYNIAKERFPLGGGFEWFSAAASLRYSPNPTLVMSPHSIYFEVLGTQGFIGLALYLLFWLLVWRQCSRLRKAGKENPELQWARTLGSMVQVSIVGYMLGGAFLNLAFWEFCFYLYAAVAVAGYVVQHTGPAVAATAEGSSGSPQNPSPARVAGTRTAQPGDRGGAGPRAT